MLDKPCKYKLGLVQQETLAQLCEDISSTEMVALGSLESSSESYAVFYFMII